MNLSKTLQKFCLLLSVLCLLLPELGWAYGTLQGFVQNGSGTGIAGVLLTSTEGSTAVSGQDGSYSMAHHEDGTYSVTTIHPCYVEETIDNIVVTDGNTTTQNFSLTSQLCLESVYPSLEEIGNDLDAIIRGAGFDIETRLALVPDSGNRMKIFGSFMTPGVASSVAVIDSYAYMADKDTVRILDISNPTNITLVGSVSTPDWARSIVVNGNNAYVADGESGLQVLDVSDPGHPVIVGSLDTPGYAWSVTVENNTAYVGDYLAGLQVIDISNPSSPVLRGSAVTPYPALGVAVDNGHAYVACGVNVNGGLQVVDISSPANPVLKGFVSSPGYARDVAVVGELAYLTDYTSGLHVVDVSNPLAPAIIGSVDTPSYTDGLVVIDDLIFVADYHSGLLAVDISDKNNPAVIGSIDSSGDAVDVVVIDTTAYVADEEGLKLIDVSDPKTSTVVGSVMTVQEAYSAVLSGSNAVVADVDGLSVISIADPTQPAVVGHLTTPGDAYDVALSGNTAFVADGRSGLQIVDISNPAAPALVQSMILPGVSNVVAVEGTTVYVANSDNNRLYIINPADVNNPLQGILYSQTRINGLTVQGNTAYLAASQAGLQLYDVSGPNPSLIGSVRMPGEATDVVVDGTTAYVTTNQSSLQVVDTGALSVTGSIPVDGYAWGVTLAGSMVYVAAGNGGVHAIDVSVAASPVLIGTVATPGYAKSVFVSGSMTGVADWHAGFSMIPVPIEITPYSLTPDNEMQAIIPSQPAAGNYNLRAFNLSEENTLAGAVTFTDNIDLLTSKAIIVAGGGPDAGYEIWEETKAYANFVYDNLLYQGYREDDIYYLTDELTAPGRDAEASRAEMENAFAWAKNDPDTSDLLLYMVDHGDTETFLIRGGTTPENVTAQDVDMWLDDFQQNSLQASSVIFFYDACRSGTFITKMTPPTGHIRVSITSSAPEEVAYFLTNSHSFSSHFWSTFSGKSGDKANLLEAFERASETMSPFQTGQIDANSNGVTNEPEDYAALKDLEGTIYALRRQYNYTERSRPVVTMVSEDQILIGSTDASLVAGNIYDIDGDKVARVWAEVVAPYFNPDPTGLTVTNLPTVELTDPDQDGVYEGDSADFDVFFNVYGTYIISYFAEDANGISSLPKTSLVMQTLADEYEIDDSKNRANIIVLNNPNPQNHNFHDLSDEDWVKFFALKGETYKIKAANPTIICDPVIELYDVDGASLIQQMNDTGPGADEFLNWNCPADGVYFVRLTNNTNHSGANVSYELKVFNPIAFSLPGYVVGTVTSSGSGVGGALLRAGGGSAISQSDGSYIMSLEPGSHGVSVSKTGYQSAAFSVSIASGSSTEKNVTLVSVQNTSPVISGTPPETVKTNEAYSFTPTASDPDNNLLVFSIEGLPEWAGFSATSGTISGFPDESQVGVYGPITLSVDDSKSTAALPPFTITVLQGTNLPPVISGKPLEIIGADRMFSFTPAAGDPNGDKLTFTISGKPPWANFNGSNGTLYGIPGVVNIGHFGPVTITVKDPSGAGAFLQPFNLQVVSGSEIDRYGVLPSIYLLLGD